MKHVFVGTVVVGALALTGCGSSDDNEDAAASTSPGAGLALDSAFGSAGVARVALSSDAKDRLSAVAIGKDGKVYAAGFTTEGGDQRLAAIRFGADGKLDSSFGTAGVASVNVSPGKALEQARGLVVQPDGKIVLAGTAEHGAAASGDAAKDTDIVAVRFDADGRLDSSFGTAGVARIDVAPGKAVDEKTYVADTGYGLALLPSGGFVIHGQASAGADRTDSDYVLVGLTAAGALDPAFGTAGYTKVDLGSSGDSARNVIVKGESLLAAGYSRGADGIVSPVMIKTSLGGKLDATFGKDGVASHKVLGAVTEAYSVAPQGDGYVLAGYGTDSDKEKVDLVVYRFTGKGELDTTFGTNGVTRIDNAKEDDRARNVTLLPDGRILVVGSGKLNATKVQAMAVVLSANGAIDTSFGKDGRVLSDFGGIGDSWYGVAVTTDGSAAYLAGFLGADPEDKAVADDSVVGRLRLK